MKLTSSCTSSLLVASLYLFTQSKVLQSITSQEQLWTLSKSYPVESLLENHTWTSADVAAVPLCDRMNNKLYTFSVFQDVSKHCEILWHDIIGALKFEASLNTNVYVSESYQAVGNMGIVLSTRPENE